MRFPLILKYKVSQWFWFGVPKSTQCTKVLGIGMTYSSSHQPLATTHYYFTSPTAHLYCREMIQVVPHEYTVSCQWQLGGKPQVNEAKTGVGVKTHIKAWCRARAVITRKFSLALNLALWTLTSLKSLTNWDSPHDSLWKRLERGSEQPLENRHSARLLYRKERKTSEVIGVSQWGRIRGFSSMQRQYIYGLCSGTRRRCSPSEEWRHWW